MSQAAACGRDFVIAILRYVVGRQAENYLPQHRDKHCGKACEDLIGFLSSCSAEGSGVTDAQLVDGIVDGLVPEKGRPDSPLFDPELRLCRAAILVYLDRLASDNFAQSRLERSRQSLRSEMHDYDKYFRGYFGPSHA